MTVTVSVIPVFNFKFTLAKAAQCTNVTMSFLGLYNDKKLKS